MPDSKRPIRKFLVPIIIIFSIVLACVSLSWAESSNKQIAPEKATVVIHCTYSPVNFWDKNTDKPSGFAVDIINSVATRAGLELRYICEPGWPALITSVETGEADITVLLKSAEREKILLFSSPIDVAYLSYFVRSESQINPDTAPRGHTVGVVKGSLSYEQLKNKPGVNLSIDGSYLEGIFSLLAGEIDIFAGEETQIQKNVREARLEDRIKKIGKPFAEQERCLVVRKGNVQLLGRLNNALHSFTGSAEYEQIYRKWYGVPVPYWTRNRILTVSGLVLIIVFFVMAFWRYKSILRINGELLRSIEGRQRSEESLRESEEKFRSIFENAIDGIMIADAETKRHIEANKSMCIMLGYTRDEIVGLRVDDIHPKEDLPAIRELFEKQLRGEILLASEAPMLRKDGSVFYADINATSVTLGGKQYLVGIFRDITERKRAEETLRKSEKFIEDILASVDQAFVVIDSDYRILSANRAYCEQAGESLGHIIGKHCYEISHHATQPCHEPGHVCACKSTFETGEPGLAVHTHTDDKGKQRQVEVRTYAMKSPSGEVQSVIEVINDITEKRALESQLRHAQKMESIGTLAGGIAHDFNNILSAIIGYGHITLMKMPKDDPLRLNIEHMLESADRAASLTQSLLTFSRKQIIDRKPVDLHSILKKVEKFLIRIIGEDVAVRLALAGGELTVMADAGQLEQVMMNLATNARDAMPHGGSFMIETSIMKMDSGFVSAHGYGKPGTYAMISATDTGVGMNEETRKNIFEPFFTTKEVGKGTGLGLAMVYGILKQNEGFINVYSEPGKGTTFRIYLPLIKASAVERRKTLEVEYQKGGTGTILLAEDDVNMRNLNVVVLEQMGYTVIQANDGAEAVTKFMENKDRIQLLLFDIMMPKKSGREAYEEIRKVMPAVPVLFVSGYSLDMLREKDLIETGSAMIIKPMSPQALLKKVREMLDR